MEKALWETVSEKYVRKVRGLTFIFYGKMKGHVIKLGKSYGTPNCLLSRSDERGAAETMKNGIRKEKLIWQKQHGFFRTNLRKM